VCNQRLPFGVQPLVAVCRYSRAAASEQFGSIACRRWCDFEVGIVSISTADQTASYLPVVGTGSWPQPVDQCSIPKRSLDADFGQPAAKWLRELLIQQVRGVP
jgi:hypothetical protein